jgi:hypothetical protein
MSACGRGGHLCLAGVRVPRLVLRDNVEFLAEAELALGLARYPVLQPLLHGPAAGRDPRPRESGSKRHCCCPDARTRSAGAGAGHTMTRRARAWPAKGTLGKACSTCGWGVRRPCPRTAWSPARRPAPPARHSLVPLPCPRSPQLLSHPCPRTARSPIRTPPGLQAAPHRHRRTRRAHRTAAMRRSPAARLRVVRLPRPRPPRPRSGGGILRRASTLIPGEKASGWHRTRWGTSRDPCRDCVCASLRTRRRSSTPPPV